MRIRRLVEQVDEQHREAMRSIADDLAETHFGVSDERVAASRRRFVRQLGLGGAVALGAVAVPVAALTSRAAAQTNDTMVDTDDTAAAGAGGESSIPAADLAIVEFAEGLELSAQAAYEVAGASPLLSAREAELCATFGRHHGEHASALGALLADSGARDATETGVPIGPLVFSLSPQIQGAADAAEVLTVMLSIEEGAAATYLSAIGTLESESVAAPAASIMPIEAQHAAVLGELLELPPDEWLPTLESTDDAFDPADYAG
jgi:hypothetical protein